MLASSSEAITVCGHFPLLQDSVLILSWHLLIVCVMDVTAMSFFQILPKAVILEEKSPF